MGRREKCYIAGPMRGIHKFNFPAFDARAELLYNLGFDPVNPADIDRQNGFDPDDLDRGYDYSQFPETMDIEQVVKRDVDALCGCSAISLLDGWSTSRGAVTEKAIADLLHIPQVHLEGRAGVTDFNYSEPILVQERQQNALLLGQNLNFLLSQEIVQVDHRWAEPQNFQLSKTIILLANWLGITVVFHDGMPVPHGGDFTILDRDKNYIFGPKRRWILGCCGEVAYATEPEGRGDVYQVADDAPVDNGTDWMDNMCQMVVEQEQEQEQEQAEKLGIYKSDTNPESVLAEAERLTRGDRNAQYGPPDQDFQRTAAMWTALFGHEFSSQDVALAMIALKLSRQTYQRKRDNWVDIAGYARCGSICDGTGS